MKKLTTETLIKQFTDKHGNRYDYSLVEYKNNRTKVKIICPVHGIFEQSTKHHKNGHGCNDCDNDKRRTPKETYINNSNIIHKNKYGYSLVNYKNSYTPIQIICPIHGIFEQIPWLHLNSGCGCPKCGNLIKGYNIETYRNRKTTLYYIKVNNLYKIGLTLESVKRRYRLDKEVNIEIIKEWVFEDGADAFILEKKILTEFNNFQYKGQKILKSGNTELFNTDIFNDISYYFD